MAIGIGKTRPEDPRYNRRIKFSLVIIISQMLLVALSVAWGIYLIVISQNGGQIISTETNKLILYGEIITTGLIVVFALVVIAMELNRMLAKRRSDRPADNRRTTTIPDNSNVNGPTEK